jgi:hypothetical protein
MILSTPSSICCGTSGVAGGVASLLLLLPTLLLLLPPSLLPSAPSELADVLLLLLLLSPETLPLPLMRTTVSTLPCRSKHYQIVGGASASNVSEVKTIVHCVKPDQCGLFSTP